MKKDLATSILAAILGFVIVYIIAGVLMPELDEFSFKALNADTNYDVASPNPEIFNYRAINPTVEVYVGECEEYNESGECIDDFDGLQESEVSDGSTD